MKLKEHYLLVLAATLLILLVVILFSASLGSRYLSPLVIFQAIFSPESLAETVVVIVTEIRLPRILLSFLVGAGLAMAGVVFQGVIRNPMVDPYIVGISAGAGTGVALGIILDLNWRFMGIDTLPLLAFLGALLTVFIVYQLSVTGGKIPVMTFLLAGVAMGFVLNAIMSFLMVIGTDELHKIVYWLMGSLAGSSWQDLRMIFPYYLAGLIPLIFYVKDLNLILLGEDNARSLGVNVERAKKVLITGATLLTASVVSVSGNIGFIGLVIPHIVRILVGPDHRKLLPLSALGGGIFLLLSDDLARTLLAPVEIPVGIITALAGGPYFIYLLYRNKVGE